MTTSKRIPVYDTTGRIIATVDSAKNRWFGQFLLECPEGHVYVADQDALLRDQPDECPVCDGELVDEQVEAA